MRSSSPANRPGGRLLRQGSSGSSAHSGRGVEPLPTPPPTPPPGGIRPPKPPSAGSSGGRPAPHVGAELRASLSRGESRGESPRRSPSQGSTRGLGHDLRTASSPAFGDSQPSRSTGALQSSLVGAEVSSSAQEVSRGGYPRNLAGAPVAAGEATSGAAALGSRARAVPSSRATSSQDSTAASAASASAASSSVSTRPPSPSPATGAAAPAAVATASTAPAGTSHRGGRSLRSVAGAAAPEGGTGQMDAPVRWKWQPLDEERRQRANGEGASHLRGRRSNLARIREIQGLGC